MRSFLLGFLLASSPAMAVNLKVTERYVPNFSQTGAIQVGPEGHSLNHGCEWFHFANLTTFSGSKPIKITTKIRSSSGTTGFYFGLKESGFVALKLAKLSGQNPNSLIQLVRFLEDGSSKVLASKTFNHNNDQWISGTLEFEFVPSKSKIMGVKFDGQDFMSEFARANDSLLGLSPEALKGAFGSFCFVGYSHLRDTSIDGSSVIFNF